MESGSHQHIEEHCSSTVFVSYSWDSDAHIEWVLRLAARMRQDGVAVILDKWHLRLGDDRLLFMERSIAKA